MGLDATKLGHVCPGQNHEIWAKLESGHEAVNLKNFTLKSVRLVSAYCSSTF